MSARLLGLVDALVGLVVKQPVTGRSCTQDFGPTPGAVHRERLAAFTDAELYQHGAAILADLNDRSEIEA